jgi:hypothetical protein
MPASDYLFTGRMTLLAACTVLLTSTSSVLAAAEAEPAATENAMTTEPMAPATNDTPSGRVARAIFTTAIADREPVDDLKTVPNSTSRVYFFSDLRGLEGQIVTHRWEYDGQVMAEITFKVGAGARWRVYSSKNLLPEWTGTWTVIVSNEGGQVLQTSTFDYVDAAAQ